MRFPFLIHALIGLTSLCGAAPAGDTTSIEKPSNLAPARKLPDDVGLPSQLAWEAWLIIAKRPDAPSSFESATLPRRIAPKSIFVAPLRDAESQCSDGYKRNGTGHCVRDTIKIDPMNSNRDFQRKRLIMFPPTLTVKYSPPVDSASSASDPVKVDLGGEDTGPMEISLVQVRPFQESGSSKNEDVMTPYEVGSDGEPETIIRLNSTDLPVRGVVLPVAKIVDERNQTVVDYETPVNVEIVQSSGLKQAVDSVTESNLAGEAQPTVILLMSAPKNSSPPEGTEPPETSEVTTVQREEGTTLADEATTLETSEAPSTTIHPEEDAVTLTESTDEILLHGETSRPGSSTPPSLSLPKTDEGNVSSESTITGDRIMETTLLDVNPVTTSSRSDLDDFREIFEVEEFAPEVVSSPQGGHGSNTPVSRITKRTGDPELLTSSRNASRQGELQERRRTSEQSRVRFPDEQRPKGFVTFPSDNRSNSVHGDLDPRAQLVQGQKRTYYRLPTGWRVSDPQQQHVARSSIQQLQNQMRLRFWARMPLIRDPSLPGGSSQTTVNNQRDGVAYRDRVIGQSVRGGQVQTG